MPICGSSECKFPVPAPLESHGLCVLHFTLAVEQVCGEMRRETVLGHASHDRQLEITSYITNEGERLARVATAGLNLTDEIKARILNTFLTLMNLRENLDRAALRQPVGRTGGR